MATNRKIGNTFETEFCELLFQRGFWCHNMAQNAAGQPADVIAVKNKTAYLIDCTRRIRERNSLLYPLLMITINPILTILLA